MAATCKTASTYPQTLGSDTNSRKHQESKERMRKSGKFMMEVGHQLEGRDVTLCLADRFLVVSCFVLLFSLLGCTQKKQVDQK